MNKSILIISDTHIPYHHPDLIPFLKDLKEIYKPDRVIHIGDEVDKHAMSFHDSDPDRLDMYNSPKLINNLRVTAVHSEFRR